MSTYEGSHRSHHSCVSIGSLPSKIYSSDSRLTRSSSVSSKDFRVLARVLGVGILQGGTVVLGSLFTGLGLEHLGPPLVRA